LFGRKGRSWLTAQALPADERVTIDSVLRELDHVGEDLAAIDRDLAQIALTHPAAQRLMTIPGVDVAVALGLVAAIGPITRFRSPQKLVSYLGLNPRVRQSGLQPAHHGRITKQGHAHALGMLVEAAWVAAKTPGPLRAFFLRIRGRRGEQIAAVATARKLAVLVWHLLTANQDYAWGRPLLAAQKRRALELRPGLPARRGQRGATHGYNLKERRDQEREIGAQSGARLSDTSRALASTNDLDVARWLRRDASLKERQCPVRGVAYGGAGDRRLWSKYGRRFSAAPLLTLPTSGKRTDSEARVPPKRRASTAPKRHLRGGACSLVPHASVGVTRAQAQPIAARRYVPLDTFIRRADDATMGEPIPG